MIVAGLPSTCSWDCSLVFRSRGLWVPVPLPSHATACAVPEADSVRLGDGLRGVHRALRRGRGVVRPGGGWKGAGLVAAWAFPLAALAFAGWFWPRRAIGFPVVSAGVMAIAIWFAIDPDGWVSFRGPERTRTHDRVLRRSGQPGFPRVEAPLLGGSFMLAVSVIPAVLATIAADRGFVALTAVGAQPQWRGSSIC